MRLAEKGFDVVAAVEIRAQVQTLKRQAAGRGVTLRMEKLDVTDAGDRRKALAWNVEILVNNAGLGEGGSTVDIPESNIRRQFEVNVTGPLLLTQGIARQMARRGAGRIVWVSSREGLNVNPFTGLYSASKHAVEAIAESMADELREFGVEVAAVNPGPFLTGFNDRIFQTWTSWEDDPSERLFDYSKLAFPRAQFDPEPVYATMTAVAAGEVDSYRNLEPKSMLEETKKLIDAPWHQGRTRHPSEEFAGGVRHDTGGARLRIGRRQGRRSRCPEDGPALSATFDARTGAPCHGYTPVLLDPLTNQGTAFGRRSCAAVSSGWGAGAARCRCYHRW
jgi:hypothetical protein